MKHSTRYQLKHLVVPSLLFLPLIAYDIWFLQSDYIKTRDFDDYLGDVRAMNNYCRYYLGLVAILIAFLFKEFSQLRTVRVPVSPFFVALLASSFAVLFIPVEYHKVSLATEMLWMRGLLAEQCTVIYAAYGLVAVLLLLSREMKEGTVDTGKM